MFDTRGEQGCLINPAQINTGDHVLKEKISMDASQLNLKGFLETIEPKKLTPVLKALGYVAANSAVFEPPKCPPPVLEPHQRRNYWKNLALKATPGELCEFKNETTLKDVEWARRLRAALEKQYKSCLVEEVKAGVLQVVSWDRQTTAFTRTKPAQYKPYGFWIPHTDVVKGLVVGQEKVLPVPAGIDALQFQTAVGNRAKREYPRGASCRTWRTPGVVHIRRDA